MVNPERTGVQGKVSHKKSSLLIRTSFKVVMGRDCILSRMPQRFTHHTQIK